MDLNTFPTKGNLIAAKNSLGLAYTGYGPMDEKRNILIWELMELIDEAKGIQSEIDSTFREAYAALQKVNIELGINYAQEIGAFVPIDDRVETKARSIMGTEIPLIQHGSQPLALTYGFYNTIESLDEARYHFEKIKELTIKLSMMGNSAYRLANSTKKAQKRANALKNITIPHYEDPSKSISNALEGKEGEGFARLKVTKRNKEKVQEVFTYTSDDLVGIIAKPRSPEGCPWDRERTFESLKKCLVDEIEEVFQAIDSKDMESLREELGDVLLQVILNSQIAKEESRLTINDVVDGLCRKMVRRYPHVSGGVKVNSAEEGIALWNQIKMQEKVKKP